MSVCVLQISSHAQASTKVLQAKASLFLNPPLPPAKLQYKTTPCQLHTVMVQAEAQANAQHIASQQTTVRTRVIAFLCCVNSSSQEWARASGSRCQRLSVVALFRLFSTSTTNTVCNITADGSHHHLVQPQSQSCRHGRPPCGASSRRSCTPAHAHTHTQVTRHSSNSKARCVLVCCTPAVTSRLLFSSLKPRPCCTGSSNSQAMPEHTTHWNRVSYDGPVFHHTSGHFAVFAGDSPLRAEQRLRMTTMKMHHIRQHRC